MTNDRDADQPKAAPPLPNSARQWSEIARLLSQSQRVLSQLLTGLAPMSESEMILIWVCSEAPAEGLAQVGLADSLGISAGQISSMVERLRGRGLLESNRSSSDRRRRYWRLTPLGRQQLSEACRILADRVAQWQSQPLSEADRKLLCQFLTRLAESRRPAERFQDPASSREERAA